MDEEVLQQIKIKFHYTCLFHFRVSRLGSAYLRGIAPEPTLQVCSGGESLTTCGMFDRTAPQSDFLPPLLCYLICRCCVWIN